MYRVGDDASSEFHFIRNDKQHSKADKGPSHDMKHLMNRSILSIQ